MELSRLISTNKNLHNTYSLEKSKHQRFVHSLKKNFMLQEDLIKECIGEFVGTFMLIVFGCGVMAAEAISTYGKQQRPSAFSISIGWGLAVYLGVLFSGKAGKGHINPAVSAAFALMGEINVIQLLFYTMAQFLGALTGAACLLGVYYEGLLDATTVPGIGNIIMKNDSVLCIFATCPGYEIDNMTGFADQIFGTFLLVCGIMAITDQYNFNIPDWAQPLHLGLLVTLIVQGFGVNAGAAINPARDLAPRIVVYLSRWGSEAFSNRNYYFWVPIVGPYVGAPLGMLFYFAACGLHLPAFQAENKI